MADELQPPGDELAGSALPAEAVTGSAEDEELAGADEAAAWRGWKLDELGGGGVGRIEGVYLDAEDGAPRWLQVRMGRFGHYSAVPFSHAVPGAGRVWLPYERAAIRNAPRLESRAPLSREAELALCAHFGIPERAGRAAELSKRPAEAVTARLGTGG